jgi:hypothetical protein
MWNSTQPYHHSFSRQWESVAKGAYLKVIESQFRLKTIPHLYKSVIRFVVQNFDTNNVAVVGKQIEKFLCIYSLEHNKQEQA